MKKYLSIILPLFLLSFLLTHARETHPLRTITFQNDLLFCLNEMAENFTPDEFKKIESVVKEIDIEVNNVYIPAGYEKRIPVDGTMYRVTLKTRKNCNYYLQKVEEMYDIEMLAIEVNKVMRLLSYFVKGYCSFSYNLEGDEDGHVSLTEPIIVACDRIMEFHQSSSDKLAYRMRGLGIELQIKNPLNAD